MSTLLALNHNLGDGITNKIVSFRPPDYLTKHSSSRLLILTKEAREAFGESPMVAFGDVQEKAGSHRCNCRPSGGKKGIAEKERCASNRFKRKKGRLRKILNVVFLRRQRSAAIKSNGDVFPRALAANHLSCRLGSTLKSSFLFPFLAAAVPVPRPRQQRKKKVCLD